MKVDFIDLKAQYLTIKDEIDEATQDVIDNTAFSSGKFVESFEENFAASHNVKYCAGVNSGTSALHIALWALGIGEGDEVIVPANTFIATPAAVSLCRATPVFVDCEPDYYNIDPEKIEDAITDKTKAIIVVHLYGQPAKLDEIKAIAEKRNLLLIEDCAQAHLAQYKGRIIGGEGICSCFSFYPGKNLGAYGEAGAVLTNNKELHSKILALRNHGSTQKHHHDYIGHNYRMDGIQGAVLDVKLKHLDKWTLKRRETADLYRKFLNNIDGVVLPLEMEEVKHVYHLFVIRVKKREKLQSFLRENNVFTGIHYPIPCHKQKAYANLSEIPILPVSESYADEILSLPIFPEYNI